MKIHFTLSESDFLMHQLWGSYKSKQIRKGRQRSRILPLAAYAIIGLFFVLTGDYSTGYAFFILTVLWLLIYPGYERNRYRKHYLNFIREHYKNRFDKDVTIQLEADYIQTWNDASESKIKLSEFEEIAEIKTLILIKLKNGTYLALPKGKIEEIDLLKIKLKAIAGSLNIQYIEMLDWEWK